MFLQRWAVGGGDSRTQLVPRDLCNVRLAGTLVSMELICPLLSEEQRGMDMARMP